MGLFALTVRRKLCRISTEVKTVKYADTFLLQCCFVWLLKFDTELLYAALWSSQIHLTLRAVLKPSRNTATLNAAHTVWVQQRERTAVPRGILQFYLHCTIIDIVILWQWARVRRHPFQTGRLTGCTGRAQRGGETDKWQSHLLLPQLPTGCSSVSENKEKTFT